jgi:hypothetical protein
MKKGGYHMISPIGNISVQNMAYMKQNAQPNSKVNEEANESAAEKAREAHSDNPSIGRRLDALA